MAEPVQQQVDWELLQKCAEGVVVDAAATMVSNMQLGRPLWLHFAFFNFMHVSSLYKLGNPISRDMAYKILEYCTRNKDVQAARQVYGLMVFSGLTALAVLGDHLIRLFGGCENFLEANLVFSGIAKPSAHTWQAIISAHAQAENFAEAFWLYYKMQEEGVEASKFVLSSMLKLCSSGEVIGEGRLIHCQVISYGLEMDMVIGSTLISMYANCGSLKDAVEVFEGFQQKDVVLWNAMITCFSQHGHGLQALQTYEKMQEAGVKPAKVTFSSVLKACGITKDIRKGRELHSLINRSECAFDVVVGSAIIDMYVKCGSLKEAQESFDELPNLNAITWNAMIAAYGEKGFMETAFDIFVAMHSYGVEADRITLMPLIKGCGCLHSIDQGRLVHIYMVRNGFGLDIALGTSLVGMYVGLGSLEDAQKVFDTLPDRTLATWGTIIDGFAQHGHGLHALEIFAKMPHSIKPDSIMLLSALKACATVGASVQGFILHDQVIRWSHESELAFGTTLIDMYSKCGSLKEAHKVFLHMLQRDVVSWGAMVAAYAQYGDSRLAGQCLEEMQRQGFTPDVSIYTNMLAACSHSCDVKEGLLHFKNMKDHGITPAIEHYNSMVVLLSQAGCLKEAGELLQSIPFSPYTTGWTTLLAACRTHNSLELGRECFHQAVELDPNVASGYVLMSNIYADNDMLEDAGKLYDLRNCVSAWKKPAGACIEVNEKMHNFIVDDITKANLSSILNGLNNLLKIRGHVPQSGYIMDHVS